MVDSPHALAFSIHMLMLIYLITKVHRFNIDGLDAIYLVFVSRNPSVELNRNVAHFVNSENIKNAEFAVLLLLLVDYCNT